MRTLNQALLGEAKQGDTLLNAATRALRADIISGLYPPNEPLRIRALEKRYGISAGTVREALARLGSESLIRADQQRGYSVCPMSAQDVEEIAEMRLLVELEALRSSIANGDDQWEAKLVGAHYLLTRLDSGQDSSQSIDIAVWDDRNWEFHFALISACPSSWNKNLVLMLYRQWARYCYQGMKVQSFGELHREHRAIFDAALARDADTACDLLREHVMATAARFSVSVTAPE